VEVDIIGGLLEEDVRLLGDMGLLRFGGAFMGTGDYWQLDLR
jgi:hypothetical protein